MTRMRTILLLSLLLVVSGCLGSTHRDPPPKDPEPDTGQRNTTLYLKAGNVLSTDPPAKSTPDRVGSNPIVNGFANEDLAPFRSSPTNATLSITKAKLTVYYEVDGPTASPFLAGNRTARHFVFWLGSNATYPITEGTWGEPVVVPMRTYQATLDFPIPSPSWHVPVGETFDLLVATLVANDPLYDLRFLVDSKDTPSRLELWGRTANATSLANATSESKDYTIPGNTGLFTGGGSQLPSRIGHKIEVAEGTSYLQVAVRFKSNAGGKSDLDLVLRGPDAKTAAANSTTPFQDETIRLFKPNLDRFGPGTYTAEVTAYSGIQTTFSIVVRRIA